MFINSTSIHSDLCTTEVLQMTTELFLKTPQNVSRNGLVSNKIIKLVHTEPAQTEDAWQAASIYLECPACASDIDPPHYRR